MRFANRIASLTAVLSVMFIAPATAHAEPSQDRDFLAQAGLSMASVQWQRDGIVMAHQMCGGFVGRTLDGRQAADIATRRFGTYAGSRLPAAAVNVYCPFNRPANLPQPEPMFGSS